MRNWRPLERWSWSFQQWALFYADLHPGKSFPQAVNMPHSQSKWRFGKWKTEAGAETSLASITLTYIKLKISQTAQLLALTLFQKLTIKQYYQNENSHVKFDIFLVLSLCKRSASLNKNFVGISFDAFKRGGKYIYGNEHHWHAKWMTD